MMRLIRQMLGMRPLPSAKEVELREALTVSRGRRAMASRELEYRRGSPPDGAAILDVLHRARPPLPQEHRDDP